MRKKNTHLSGVQWRDARENEIFHYYLAPWLYLLKVLSILSFRARIDIGCIRIKLEFHREKDDFLR